jgi:hypothetical protein
MKGEQLGRKNFTQGLEVALGLTGAAETAKASAKAFGLPGRFGRIGWRKPAVTRHEFAKVFCLKTRWVPLR